MLFIILNIFFIYRMSVLYPFIEFKVNLNMENKHFCAFIAPSSSLNRAGAKPRLISTYIQNMFFSKFKIS